MYQGEVMSSFRQFGSRFRQTAAVGIFGTTSILGLLVATPASANCDGPAYQQCPHLQADVEGMARTGDARYLGRSFGNKDIQCTTLADLNAAQELIRACASRGEWTSDIQISDAQSLLVRINQSRLLPSNPVRETEEPHAENSQQSDIFNDSIQAFPAGGIDNVPTIEADPSPLPVIAPDTQAQSVVVAPPADPAPAASDHPPSPTDVRSNVEKADAAVPTAPVRESESLSPVFWGIAISWLAIVVCGIVAGWNQKIVVFRNYDDLAMMFFMLAVPLCIVWIGDYGAILAMVFFFVLLTWASIRTWQDQSPRSVWAFGLALITKLSLGILFVWSLWSLISPGGKTQLARARARASALATLALLTPIVTRLVRDHEGIWSPRNVLTPHQRRRMRISP